MATLHQCLPPSNRLLQKTTSLCKWSRKGIIIWDPQTDIISLLRDGDNWLVVSCGLVISFFEVASVSCYSFRCVNISLLKTWVRRLALNIQETNCLEGNEDRFFPRQCIIFRCSYLPGVTCTGKHARSQWQQRQSEGSEYNFPCVSSWARCVMWSPLRVFE